MGVEVLIPLGMFAMIALVFWIGVSQRSSVRRQALITIEKAIEKGIDPSTLPLDLEAEKAESRGNRYGNWKAGIILIFVGLALSPMMILAFLTEREVHSLAVPLIPIILGLGFLFMHKFVESRRKNEDSSGSQD